jgi:hypothetical protein
LEAAKPLSPTNGHALPTGVAPRGLSRVCSRLPVPLRVRDSTLMQSEFLPEIILHLVKRELAR